MSAPARPKPDRSKPSSQGFAIPGAAPALGIKVLHDNEQTNIDIPFIHGLSGHREKTWTAPGETDPWPKTLLPAKVPNARILTYGYDANWKKGPASTNRTKEHASNFMNRLTQFRDEDQSENNPLIFVCHSLGGLVCMDTLVHSKEQADPRLRSIYERTIGVAFLGTPHQGSGLASPAQKLSSLMRPFNQTNSEIVQVLKQDSEILSRIQDSFQLMLQGRSRDGLDPILITYFFEELEQSRLLGIIVPKHSATRPGCPQIGIRANHSNMTKFAEMNDDGFQKVSGEINRWASNIKFMSGHASTFIPWLSAEIDTAVPQDARAHFVVPYPTNPEFVGRENILQELKDRLDYRDVHRMWHPRVALYGLGGVGKTHVVIAFVYWFKVKYPDVSIYWVHASNTERFRESFMSAAQECHITGLEDPKNDVLRLFSDWLKNKDHGWWLVVVENADDAELFTSHHKRSSENLSEATRNLGNFIPECAHGGVLITTRNIQAGSRLVKGNQLLEVQKMDSPECEILLLSQIPKDIATTAEIMTLSGELEFLPLAIAQAAAFIRENRISVAKYLDVFRQNKVKLLQEEFETIGRDPDTPRALSATWILSHQQIQRQNPLAGEFLSLMSLFDRQDVPLAFFTNYYERKRNEEGDAIEITKALGILKGFCLISQQRNGNFDMHRLVQLVARDWLGGQCTRNTVHEEALLTVLETFPDGSDIKWRDTCSAYLSHAQAVFGRFPGIVAKSAISASLAFSISKYYCLLGKWQDMGYWAREARGIQLDLFGKEDPKTIEYTDQLARACWSQGKFREAEELQVQVLKFRKRILGEEHPSTITSMGNIASIYINQGRLREAEQLELQVLKFRKRVLGEEHPNTITSMANLASTYGDQGRLQEAEQLELQVLELRKRVLGEEHPLVLRSMLKLAVT